MVCCCLQWFIRSSGRGWPQRGAKREQKRWGRKLAVVCYRLQWFAVVDGRGGRSGGGFFTKGLHLGWLAQWYLRVIVHTTNAHHFKAMDRTTFLNAREGGAVAALGAVDVVGLREHLGVVLWETVVATFAEGKGDAGDERPAVPKASMLSVRLKALRQIGKLYGLGEGRKGKVREREPVACATPEEIAALVGEWREREGR